jgi:ATP-dependent RNA helicase RhlE
MLDMGFIHDLKRIVKHVPDDRQTLMFSATMPPEIRRLSAQWLDDPKTLQSTPEASTPDKIKQSVTFVNKPKKPNMLIQFLQTTSGERNLVFCRTKRGVDRVVRYLRQARIHAMAIHGDKTQRARQQALEQFSSPRPPVLVATDVAARGLHMPDVSSVINYDLPETPETYVHRIGRTARAGAEGASISFCSEDERPYLKRIEKLIKQAVKEQKLTVGDQGTARQDRAQQDDRPVPAKPRSQNSGSSHGSKINRRKKTSRRPFKSKGPAAGGKKRRGTSRKNKKAV